MSEGSLLLHLVTALGAAMIGAAVALRFRQPLILGYILAGVAIGPFTPGFIGNTEVIAQLAEIGVVFLMFVIGVQLSPRELLRASRVAILGGLVQVTAMIGIGYLVGRAFGWGHLESFAFGAVISNSSSTVLAKILSDRGEIDSGHARLGLAWSSVQDISTVVIVAVFAFASTTGQPAGPLLGKAAVFFFVVLPLAFFGLPWILHRFSGLRSREFFALAVVTLALAMAGGQIEAGRPAPAVFKFGLDAGDPIRRRHVRQGAAPDRIFVRAAAIALALVQDGDHVAFALGVLARREVIGFHQPQIQKRKVVHDIDGLRILDHEAHAIIVRADFRHGFARQRQNRRIIFEDLFQRPMRRSGLGVSAAEGHGQHQEPYGTDQISLRTVSSLSGSSGSSASTASSTSGDSCSSSTASIC